MHTQKCVIKIFIKSKYKHAFVEIERWKILRYCICRERYKKNIKWVMLICNQETENGWGLE